jgi:hypothetical protein
MPCEGASHGTRDAEGGTAKGGAAAAGPEGRGAAGARGRGADRLRLASWVSSAIAASARVSMLLATE